MVLVNKIENLGVGELVGVFAGVAEAAMEIAGFERGDVERREIHAFTSDR